MTQFNPQGAVCRNCGNTGIGFTGTPCPCSTKYSNPKLSHIEEMRKHIAELEAENGKLTVKNEELNMCWGYELQLTRQLYMSIDKLKTRNAELEARNNQLVEALEKAGDELYEVNMGNYDDDEVSRLNSGSITANQIIQKALTTNPDTKRYELREAVVRAAKAYANSYDCLHLFDENTDCEACLLKQAVEALKQYEETR